MTIPNPNAISRRLGRRNDPNKMRKSVRDPSTYNRGRDYNDAQDRSMIKDSPDSSFSKTQPRTTDLFQRIANRNRTMPTGTRTTMPVVPGFNSGGNGRRATPYPSVRSGNGRRSGFDPAVIQRRANGGNRALRGLKGGRW